LPWRDRRWRRGDPDA
jgi:hypothetical protein